MTHYIATPMHSSCFRSYPPTACSMLVTCTTQPTHFRALCTLQDTYIQVIMTQNVPFLLLTRDQQHICTYEIQTCYSGPTTCMNPSHFNLIHHLHHFSHACTLSTQHSAFRLMTCNLRTPIFTCTCAIHNHCHITQDKKTPCLSYNSSNNR